MHSKETRPYPDNNGHFGIYGGRYVAETLMPALLELNESYQRFTPDPKFQAEFQDLLKNYAGRPMPLFHAQRLSEHLQGAAIYLKREDLNHTGAHKINNALGQALLAKRMGKRRIVAETGAGQHGVGTATACALLGLECVGRIEALGDGVTGYSVGDRVSAEGHIVCGHCRNCRAGHPHVPSPRWTCTLSNPSARRHSRARSARGPSRSTVWR